MLELPYSIFVSLDLRTPFEIAAMPAMLSPRCRSPLMGSFVFIIVIVHYNCFKPAYEPEAMSSHHQVGVIEVKASAIFETFIWVFHAAVAVTNHMSIHQIALYAHGQVDGHSAS